MVKLFLDIETIPAQRADIVAEVIGQVTRPRNIKKQETIERWESEEKPGLMNEALLKTSLQGAFGEVISVAWAVDDGPVIGLIRNMQDPEADLLTTFFERVKMSIHESNQAAMHNQQVVTASPTIVGHHVAGFDIPFIFQRCVVNNVKPTIWWPSHPNPWDNNIFDTRFEWGGRTPDKGTSSLDVVCKALGLPGKEEGIDGSQVWDYIQAGRYAEVLEYNRQDVERVRRVYKRLNFQET